MRNSAISIDGTLEIEQKRQFSMESAARAWIVCLAASLFFFYEFIQMNMFNALSIHLMQAFHINATNLGQISAYYFIANVIFLFPAGMLLDRYSTRKIILTSLGICIVGTALFAFTTTVFWASLFRFMTGIGSAFCFLSVIRLATRWFPSARLALITGVIVTIAMAGGMIAQTPLTLLVQVVNWRTALFIDAMFGVVILFIIFMAVQDYPSDHQERYVRERQQVRLMGYWKSMGLAFLRLQNWLGGTYACLMNLSLSLLGGIWGILYLVNVREVSKLEASYIISMLFLGMILGSPLVGLISDSIGLRRLPMLIGAIVSLGLILIMIWVPHLSFATLMLLFLFIGLTISAQIISYPTVAENSVPAITAMSVSVVNITTMSGQAIFQPIFGQLMDLHARYFHQPLGHYTAADFSWAVLILPIGIVFAFIAACFMRETYCQPRSSSHS